MKNWARKFNPHKTAYRTSSLFIIRKINQIKKIKNKKIKKGT
jgi:hypothetical protein